MQQEPCTPHWFKSVPKFVLAPGLACFVHQHCIASAPVSQLMTANQAISKSIKPLPVMYSVHVEAISTTILLCTDPQHAYIGIGINGDWPRYVELVSRITQQGVQHVA